MSTQSELIEQHIAKEEKNIADKLARDMNRTRHEAHILRSLPILPDARYLPRVCSHGIRSIDYSASLTWDDFLKPHDFKPFTDDEVALLMDLFQPLWMARKKDGAVSFEPFLHEEGWRALWDEPDVQLKNGQTITWTPVAPFIMTVDKIHSVRQKIAVEWFSIVGDDVVKCKVALGWNDPARIEYTRGAWDRRSGTYTSKPERFIPCLGGNYAEQRWWVNNKETDIHAAIYWPHPDEESMTWKSVIDYSFRIDHKEKLREREQRKD